MHHWLRGMDAPAGEVQEKYGFVLYCVVFYSLMVKATYEILTVGKDLSD